LNETKIKEFLLKKFRQGTSCKVVKIYKAVSTADCQQMLQGLAPSYYLKAHVFLPASFRFPSSGKDYPCVIMFHGGGWVSGAPDMVFGQCALLAEKGFVAIAPEYRLYGQKGTSIYDSIADAWSAFDFVVKNSELFRIDVTALSVAGASAGGHLAACLSGGIMRPSTIEGSIASAVLFNPVTALTNDSYSPSSCMEGDDLQANRQGPPSLNHWAFVKTIGEDMESISPVHNMNEIPPTIIFHGQDDRTVPIEQSRVYQEKVVASGSKCVLIEYAGQQHGFAYSETGCPAGFLSTACEMLKFLGCAQGNLQPSSASEVLYRFTSKGVSLYQAVGDDDHDWRKVFLV
ncbi:hypothetical protein CYMTET_17172, partial [Cymbomonas tetramitiformis]